MIKLPLFSSIKNLILKVILIVYIYLISLTLIAGVKFTVAPLQVVHAQ